MAMHAAQHASRPETLTRTFEPPIDGAIDLADSQDEMSARVDVMVASITRALDECTDRQRLAWVMMTGFRKDGTLGEPMTESAVARLMEIKKEAARAHYLNAEVRVQREILRSLMAHAAPPTKRVTKRGSRYVQ